MNFDLPWNPAILEQRIARIHRLGQTRPVQVINFVAKGTIEEGMLSILAYGDTKGSAPSWSPSGHALPDATAQLGQTHLHLLTSLARTAAFAAPAPYSSSPSVNR